MFALDKSVSIGCAKMRSRKCTDLLLVLQQEGRECSLLCIREGVDQLLISAILLAAALVVDSVKNLASCMD